MMLIEFNNFIGTLEPYFYHNMNLCLRIESPVFGSIATCTINLPELDPPSGAIFVKDYSENKGMLKALLKANVIEDITKQHRSGHVIIHEATLTESIKNNLYLSMTRRYKGIVDDHRQKVCELIDYQPKYMHSDANT